ncbi:hypothetical protein [Martelella sp. AD-3]|uniref:hypothetical protein n=1 Tax=Martelella sp. AD-3 TaxID=686597 RepID=UPI000A702B67|nr:hypothetical protein [Martelella sp. AD-3]|tara:strand:- start:184 stop:447 length:264 start_codon:yes stop_codon:yes gene_type:complete
MHKVDKPKIYGAVSRRPLKELIISREISAYELRTPSASRRHFSHSGFLMTGSKADVDCYQRIQHDSSAEAVFAEIIERHFATEIIHR